jgi:hypothetical protein
VRFRSVPSDCVSRSNQSLKLRKIVSRLLSRLKGGGHRPHTSCDRLQKHNPSNLRLQWVERCLS